MCHSINLARGGCRGHLLCESVVTGSGQLHRYSIFSGWKLKLSCLGPHLKFHLLDRISKIGWKCLWNVRFEGEKWPNMDVCM
jgi:hypothetical protein